MRAFLDSIGYAHWILSVLLLLPMAGVALVLLAPERWARWLTLIVAIAEFVLALGLWWAFDPDNGGMQFAFTMTWLPELGISYRIGLDGLSLFMILLATAMMPLLVWGSWFAIDQKVRGYYALLLALKTGMIGVFISLDLFLFYCFWELLLIPMYFLIGTWGSSNRLYAATKFVVYTFAGSILMLVAIITMVTIVARGTGETSFAYDHLVRHSDLLAPYAPWLFSAFALAFAVKVPIFPFHTWLPDAHVEAPTAGSVDLAVILLKMGTYGFLRFAIPFFPAFALSRPVAAVFVALAVIGIVYAALVSMVQPDLKKLIAYSSVSHLGFVMLGIWGGTVASVQGAIIVMIAHGISTGRAVLPRRHAVRAATYAPAGRLWRPRAGYAEARGGVRHHGVRLDRAAGTQRLRGRVPGPDRQLRPLPDRGGHRHHRRGLLRGVPAGGGADGCSSTRSPSRRTRTSRMPPRVSWPSWCR